MASTATLKTASSGPSSSLCFSKQSPISSHGRHLVVKPLPLQALSLSRRSLHSSFLRRNQSQSLQQGSISAFSANGNIVAGARAPGLHHKRKFTVQASRTDQVEETSTVPDSLAAQTAAVSDVLVGEDAGVFDVTAQKTSSWVSFTAVLAVVLAILYVVWIDPTTGYGGKFIDGLEGALGGSHEVRNLLG